MRYLLLMLIAFYLSGCIAHVTPKPTPVVEAKSEIEFTFLSNIVEGETDLVQDALEDGLNPNIQSKKLSAIELAVRQNNYEMVQTLLKYGANPLEKMSNTYLDISVAAYSSSVEDSRILELMFEYGANAQNINNFSAFSGAASNNREENFRFLLEHGLDVNATIKQKDSILSFCAYDPSRVNMTKLLLESGADVNAQTDQNVTALQNAIVKENSENVELLLSFGADVNHVDFQGNNAVVKAVKFDNKEVLQVLIKYKADITSKVYGKVTPLIIACVLDNYGAAQVIVDALKEKDSGYILVAYKYGDSKMFNFLLDNGFGVPNIAVGKALVNLYLANDRDVELNEYLGRYGFDEFELRFVSLQARVRLEKIFDKLLLKNSLSDERKIAIAKNFQYARDNERAYAWMMSVPSEKVTAKFKCVLSSNIAKTDIKACEQYAQELKDKGSNLRLSYIYLILKEYDKSINATKLSLKKEKKPYVYSNMGHSYLLKGDKKRAYRAYKNYFVKLDKTNALLDIQADFEMLKLHYPERSQEFDDAYEYSKRVDLEIIQKYMSEFKND